MQVSGHLEDIAGRSPGASQIRAGVGPLDITYNLRPCITHTKTATVEVMITENIKGSVSEEYVDNERI
jgi:hypothetical protein